GVCRRILGNHADAADAFQATFLVLARKAASVRPRDRVGCWLHGVAWRAARKARAALRRRAKEKPLPVMLPAPAASDAWADVLPLLGGDWGRLPEIYRGAVGLGELEGRPRKEAARLLGVPEGTLSSRLAAARKMLARRLNRRGVAPAGALLAPA